MERPPWIPVARAAFGLLAAAAVADLFVRFRRDPCRAAANFFRYFTVQSNLFAAAVLLTGAVRPADRRASPVVDLVRGAAVLYLTTTGAVYEVLLAGDARARGVVPWADAVVHRVMPLVLAADWLLDPPRTRLTPRQALVWLAYPLAFAASSLRRGAAVGWYPYPFLDPDRAGGYPRVAVNCVGIAGFVLLAAWGIVAAGNARRAAEPDGWRGMMPRPPS